VAHLGSKLTIGLQSGQQMVPLGVFAIPVWQRDDGHGHLWSCGCCCWISIYLLHHLSGLFAAVM
jgi:hypothetical protein